MTDHLPSDRAVEVRGLEICTRRRPGPHTPPLLLINGLGGSLTSWDPLLEQLPERDVIMVDSPGAGRSSTPTLPILVPALADVIAEVVGELGVGTVDVLGYSHGGTIAQELARRHPATVRKLILTATMFGLGALPVPLKAHRTLLSTARFRDRAVMVRDMARLAGGRSAREPELLANLLGTRESHPPSTRGYYYQQLSLIGWSSWLWLGRLRCPTLVLHGAADPVVPQLNARLMAWRIPNARLELVADAGHLLLFDEAATAGRIISEFLDDDSR